MPAWPPSIIQKAAQSKRSHKSPAGVPSSALYIKYAFETLGVFLGSPFPAREDRLTNFRSKLEMLLIAMEKGNFEVTGEMKPNEFSLVG